jgi:hypothetical protein
MPAVRSARVLTLSDSLLQNAFSLGGASEWFAARGYPFYMLGVPTAESRFGELLIERLQAKPSVVVVDANPYFTGDVGSFQRELLRTDERTGRTRVEQLHEFREYHHRFCRQWPWVCGRNFSYFRSRKDGHWIFPDPTRTKLWIGTAGVPNDVVRFPVSAQPDELGPRYPHYRDVAGKFVAKLGLPAKCVVVTAVPTESQKRELAKYLSSSLGMTLIDPDLSDLMTFDRSHLTPESSQRWTQAFLQELEHVLRDCISPSPADGEMARREERGGRQ